MNTTEDQNLDLESPEEEERESSEQGDAEEQEYPAPPDPLDDDEELQQAFYDLYLECCGEDRYARLIEVKDVKQAEFYWGGRQYIWWSDTDQAWNLPTGQGTPYGGSIDPDDQPRFEFVTNIYQASGLTVIGAVAGAPPRIRFFPDDPDEEKDISTAEGRTKEAKLIERWNPPQLMLQDETYHAYTGGVIVYWTKYVENGETFGLDSVTMLEEGQDDDLESSINCSNCGWSAPASMATPPVPCPQCGEILTDEDVHEEDPISFPQDGEPQDVPRGRQIIEVYGALNFKRPQYVNKQAEFHYCAIEKEVHYCKLRRAFPHKHEELKAGLTFGADDVFERNARLSVAENTKLLTQTGAQQASLATFANIWFRPDAFWMLKSKTLRDRANEIFPRGCRVEFAGRVFCRSEAQSMDDCIEVCHAMPGRGQHRNGIGTSEISVQDRLNTLSNIAMETYEFGIPITYRDSQTFSQEADAEQRAAPGLEVEVFNVGQTDIRSKIMQVRADSVSPDMAKHMADLYGPITQMQTGTFPALTGAGEGAPETLGQQSMQRDQSMGRMGVFYVPLKQAHANIMTLACRMLEGRANGVLKVPVLSASGDFEAESLDIDAIEGEARAHPEGDENFPELWNQQRATMMQIMDTPYGQELSKDPGNAELFARMTGIRDLKVPGMDSWRKQLKEIAALTKLPQNEDEAQAPIAPDVEVDPKHDNNPVELACCKWWLNSEGGQKLKQKYPLGWQAVAEHCDQHEAAIPPPPPAEKPLSETMNVAFKDMPPEAQAQVLEKLGIHVTPQDFLQKLALDQAAKTPKVVHPGSEMPPQKGTAPTPAAGANLQ
jgi:hypothetical protein